MIPSLKEIQFLVDRFSIEDLREEKIQNLYEVEVK